MGSAGDRSGAVAAFPAGSRAAVGQRSLLPRPGDGIRPKPAEPCDGAESADCWPEGRVHLFQHPDFGQAILRAAEHFAARKLRPAVIEKDYYVTEALGIIAEREGDRAIFKGGTSLSKGWGLIERFSEDVDVFIDICGDDRMPGTKSIDTRLRAIRNAIDQHPGLAFSKEQSTTSKGLKRADRFLYDDRIPEIGGLSPGVLIETMVASGKAPTERRQIASFVGEFLQETGTTLGCDDEQPFEMLLLHFRRTFVEKLFAIHAKVEIVKQTGEPIGKRCCCSGSDCNFPGG